MLRQKRSASCARVSNDSIPTCGTVKITPIGFSEQDINFFNAVAPRLLNPQAKIRYDRKETLFAGLSLRPEVNSEQNNVKTATL